jgi:hypothetical protein
VHLSTVPLTGNEPTLVIHVFVDMYRNVLLRIKLLSTSRDRIPGARERKDVCFFAAFNPMREGRLHGSENLGTFVGTGSSPSILDVKEGQFVWVGCRFR